MPGSHRPIGGCRHLVPGTVWPPRAVETVGVFVLSSIHLSFPGVGEVCSVPSTVPGPGHTAVTEQFALMAFAIWPGVNR